MNEGLFKNFSKWNFIKNINNKTFLQVSVFAMNTKKLTNEEKNIIIERLISFNDAALIVSCVGKIKWLTKENIDLLTDAIVKLGISYEFVKFVSVIKNLSSENVDSLTNAVVKTNNYDVICSFAYEVNNLSPQNISMLTKSIANSKDPDHFRRFVKNIKNFTKEDKDVLVRGVINTNNYYEGIIDFINSINWLDEQYMDLFVEGVKQIGDADYIINFATEFELSEKNIDVLTEGIVNTGNTGRMHAFSRMVNLTKENKDALTKALSASDDALNICNFATKVSDLTEDNIADLTVAMVKTSDSKRLHEFLINVPNLKKENCKVIVDRIFELKDFNVISSLIEDYNIGVFSSRLGSDFEKRIIRTKDILIIAYYLFIKKDDLLIARFFGSKEKFLLFIYINKDKLFINDKVLENFIEIPNFAYVDDNVRDYLENKKVNNGTFIK